MLAPCLTFLVALMFSPPPPTRDELYFFLYYRYFYFLAASVFQVEGVKTLICVTTET